MKFLIMVTKFSEQNLFQMNETLMVCEDPHECDQIAHIQYAL